MLSLTRDLIKKTQEADPSGSTAKIKPLTVCFWSDFMANPSIMYDLFTPNSRKLDYDPDKVKVMGTKDGMIRYAIVGARGGGRHLPSIGPPMLHALARLPPPQLPPVILLVS